jgi:hypothetical protein
MRVNRFLLSERLIILHLSTVLLNKKAGREGLLNKFLKVQVTPGVDLINPIIKSANQYHMPI